VSPAVVAAVGELLELAAELLKGHASGELSEADVLAKLDALKAAAAASDAAGDAAAEAEIQKQWPTGGAG
jgi:hypothetical protein